MPTAFWTTDTEEATSKREKPCNMSAQYVTPSAAGTRGQVTDVELPNMSKKEQDVSMMMPYDTADIW